MTITQSNIPTQNLELQQSKLYSGHPTFTAFSNLVKLLEPFSTQLFTVENQVTNPNKFFDTYESLIDGNGLYFDLIKLCRNPLFQTQVKSLQYGNQVLYNYLTALITENNNCNTATPPIILGSFETYD